MKILLFIPMYNCEKQIVRVLGQLNDSVLKYISKVLIVNNCSTDNGEEAVINYCKVRPEIPIVFMRNQENYGAGGSHKVAFNYAVEQQYDYVIILHGDDQGSIADLIPHIQSGEAFKYDAFLGARFHKDSKLINYSKFRILGNHVFNTFMSVALKNKVLDMGSGLNLYSVDFLKSRFYMTFVESLSFYAYLLIYTMHMNANYKYFPISWREDDQVSNAKLFSLSKEVLGITFKYLKEKNAFFKKSNGSTKGKEYTSEVIYEV